MQNRKIWIVIALAIALLGIGNLAVGFNNLSKNCFEQTFSVVMINQEIGFLRTELNGQKVIPENGGDIANGSTTDTITTWYNATDNEIMPNYYMDTWGLSIVGLVCCGIAAVLYFVSNRRRTYY